MHEMSIMASLFKIIQEKAAQKNAIRVNAIFIRVGALSGIEPELLSFAFEFFAKSTIAEGAKFVVNKTDLNGYCKICGNKEFEPDAFSLCCPKCGSFDIKIEGDDELLLEKMEVEIENH